MTLSSETLRSIPLFDDLEDVELLQVMACFSLIDVAPGDTLFQEGTPATTACFILEGSVEAVTALPGGGEAVVGKIGVGGLIGEMALVAGGIRMATVRAVDQTEALLVSYAFFQASLNQMSAPAFKILRRVIASLSSRLTELRGRIFDALDCDGYRPKYSEVHHSGYPAGDTHRFSFPFHRFLPITPFFDSFDAEEIDSILDKALALELDKGDYVYREGNAADSCYLVVRGAVDNSIMRDRRYQLSVLGPGRVCGSNALIDGGTHATDARVRSDALILEFSSDSFRELITGTDIAAMKFQTQISQNQIYDLRTADNLLTNLVSQSHIRAGVSSLL